MKITDILNKNTLDVRVKADNKDEALKILVEVAAKSGKINDVAIALQEVFAREDVMSTGVGKGIALPHAKTNAVNAQIAACITLEEPIDFEALDGEPVDILFLILGREDNVGAHLRMLSKISRLMNNDSFRAQLLSANSPEQMEKIFMTMDEGEN
jgi:fructose-specific phosphotransferase system IIA component